MDVLGGPHGLGLVVALATGGLDLETVVTVLDYFTQRNPQV
jgi:hypothetical protein